MFYMNSLVTAEMSKMSQKFFCAASHDLTFRPLILSTK